MRKLSLWLIVVIALLPFSPAAMQDGCNTLPPRLAVGQSGQVAFTDGEPLNVRASIGLDGAVSGALPEGTPFSVVEGPTCASNIYWWRVESDVASGWIAEAADGVYFVEPASAAQQQPTAVPVAVQPGQNFTTWNWLTFGADDYRSGVPDPLAIVLPQAYAGNMPSLPVDLSNVLFVADANLSSGQTAVLTQNGFVVVPAGLPQFDEAYNEFTDDWPTVPNDYNYETDTAGQTWGHPIFITTDSMLHSLHYIFDNLLSDLEREALVERVQVIVSRSLDAAVEQYQQALGTPLETPARNAVLYLAVARKLLPQDESGPPAGLDAGLSSDSDAIVAQIMAGEGQSPLPFLAGYTEDFSQYRVRGHYAGDETLEAYFRAMMWLSRITFRANDDAETQTALLLLRSLRGGAFEDWQTVHDTLTFLIGPVDDLGPPEYGTLADEIFGADLSLGSLGDAARLATFRERISELPGPRINGLVLPDDTQAEDVAEATRGFRLMGQRFTFDAYAMQQLMYPYVGSQDNRRLLPLALDVASVMGSDLAYTLAGEAGAINFANYDTQTAALRGQTAALTTDNWLENTYGGWLWSLQPLWVRDDASYPPLMQTDAWWRKDLQTALASYTELKHDTVLYVKQPTGFGGGGPPLASYGYVEPNPLVFARISVVAALTYQGLVDRGIVDNQNYEFDTGLITSAGELRSLAFNAANFAEMARKELAGEPLTEDNYYTIQTYGTYLNILLRTLYQGEGEPDPVALVTDIANNPGAQTVLQEGVGGVDYIYVVIPAPDGRLQVARGAVFSYYEFIGDINQRMTDDEWRTLVDGGNLPPRPAWTSAFLGE